MNILKNNCFEIKDCINLLKILDYINLPSFSKHWITQFVTTDATIDWRSVFCVKVAMVVFTKDIFF